MKALLLLALLFSVNAQASDIDFNSMINEVEQSISVQAKSITVQQEQRIQARRKPAFKVSAPVEIKVDQGLILVDSSGRTQVIQIDMEDY